MADPFDMFGDDSEDEGEDSIGDANDAHAGSGALAASILVGSVNEKLASAKQHKPATEDASASPAEDEGAPDTNSSLDHIEKFEVEWPKPLYLGPMVLATSLPVGGGRGYVASRRLEPGTLVLIEEPMCAWPAEQLGRNLGHSSIRGLLNDANASQLIGDMELFHPTKEHVDKLENDDSEEARIQISEMMNLVKSEHSDEEWASLVSLAREKNVLSRNGSELSEMDAVRLMVALRYNGLETGIYRHVAMLNHDCYPNCVKLRPSEVSYSEVRATRKIEAGEALTISYAPRMLSHASRRKHLWEQHRFDIGVELKGDRLAMELVDNKLPVSSVNKWDEENLTHRIETATEELENFHSESLENIASAETADQAWEYVKALEVSTLELYDESVTQLKNERHILLIPILVLHLDVCELVQKSSLANTAYLSVLTRSVVTAKRLLKLQEEFHGKDHFDLARTTLDLAEAISELLSRAPKLLFELNFESLGNFGSWSSYENQLRKQHNRIRALYPYDASDYITAKTSK